MINCRAENFHKVQNFVVFVDGPRIYVTVHAERDHKSAILILRYGGGRQNGRILCFLIFFAHGMRKAL